VTASPDDDGLVRLQKLLAQSGVASRRKCEELMLEGLVSTSPGEPDPHEPTPEEGPSTEPDGGTDPT